jgi:AraC-like DNA-binding protein
MQSEVHEGFSVQINAGFSDQSQFSRTFKRLMGMTPAQYRASFVTH